MVFFDQLNICQVSLARDLPIIKDNLVKFNNFFPNALFKIICPKTEITIFKEIEKQNKLEIIDQDQIINFEKFKKIFYEEAKNISYWDQLNKRLGWYYQQVLKISFVLDFVKKNNENIIIWDSDTVIVNRLNFFEADYSIRYATVSEFFKAYYLTNKTIIGFLPNYFLSSLIQFVALTKKENDNLFAVLENFFKKSNLDTGEWVSKIIAKSVCDTHKEFNGSMFSEYELIGMSNLILKTKKQKIILTLRHNLNGKLTKLQYAIIKFLNFKHVTYEHSHPNKNSDGMLERNQTWLAFLGILIKSLSNFMFRLIKHELLFQLSLKEKNKKLDFIYR